MPFCIVQNLFAFWKTVMPFNNCLFSFVVDKQEARAYSKAISSYCGRWDIKQFWYTSSCGQNSILNFYACCLFVICISVLPVKKNKKCLLPFCSHYKWGHYAPSSVKLSLFFWCGEWGVIYSLLKLHFLFCFVLFCFFLMQLYFCSA